MQINLGQTYEVSNKYKKSFVEVTDFYCVSKKQSMSKELGWRSGTVLITPVDEYEVNQLQDALDNEETLRATEFQEMEFLDSWDGCWENYTSEDIDIDAYYDKFEEENEEDDYYDFSEYMLEKYGFEETEFDLYILDGIVVKEVENEN